MSCAWRDTITTTGGPVHCPSLLLRGNLQKIGRVAIRNDDSAGSHQFLWKYATMYIIIGKTESKEETMKKPIPGETLPQSPSCPGAIKVPTDREVKALAALKKIKERSRQLKNQLADLQSGGSEKEKKAAGEKLARLGEEWDLWEKERKAAADERMAILGHE